MGMVEEHRGGQCAGRHLTLSEDHRIRSAEEELPVLTHGFDTSSSESQKPAAMTQRTRIRYTCFTETINLTPCNPAFNHIQCTSHVCHMSATYRRCGCMDGTGEAKPLMTTTLNAREMRCSLKYLFPADKFTTSL